ncbi:Hypothetical predicted protein [Olea europaea subsp. europaea]|uniref:Uncharacterized protein n=1 Tax=Olea europaea subsp. europaea TaxID=158383 RepID=A0A8S0TW78_OLEEU|nr:Hypothetical predicted protein [Olea europaea subsp. europaea]
MSETRPNRDRDAALFSSISWQFMGMICRQCSGCFPTTLGTQEDFQPNEGSTVRRPCQGRMHTPKPCPEHNLIFRHFKVVSGSRCAGHVEDASEPWRGWSLIFRHFRAIFGHSVQAMSGMRPDCSYVRDVSWPQQGWRLIFRHIFAISGTWCAGHLQDATWTYPDFQAMFGSRLGRDRDRAWFPDISRQCPGRVGTAARMQPDFQAFLGSFWDTMCKPCLGRVLAAVGTQLDFLAFLNNFWDFMCRPCPRHVMATTGMETDFQAFFAVSGTRCAGHLQDATGTYPNFQAVFGTHRAAAGMQSNFQTFLGSFWDTVCMPCSGHVLAAAGTQLDF